MKKTAIIALAVVPALFLAACAPQTTFQTGYNGDYVYSGPDNLYTANPVDVGFGVDGYGYSTGVYDGVIGGYGGYWHGAYWNNRAWHGGYRR